MAEIFIEQLAVNTIIGAYSFERKQPQTLYFDLTIHSEITKAATSDDLNDALDYAKLAELVCQTAKTKHYTLIEALANDVFETIMHEFKPQYLKLKLTKPNMPEKAKAVAIILDSRGQTKGI